MLHGMMRTRLATATLGLLMLSIMLHGAAALPEGPVVPAASIDAAAVDANSTEGLGPVAQAASQGPGADCGGSEGQLNCLGTSWQRCASGRWSVVMQCAAGTQCTPSGLTYDFRVQATNNGGAYTGGAAAMTARGGRVARTESTVWVASAAIFSVIGTRLLG